MEQQLWLNNYFKQAVRFVTNFANLTACSQIIELENHQRYIIHTQTDRATKLGINYALESQILTAISPLNIAPKVIYCDAPHFILSYIDGKIPTQYSDSLLKKLAVNLVKLHQFDGSQAVTLSQHFAHLDIIERCYFLYYQLPVTEQQHIDLSVLQPIKPFSQSICHHDLHLANFVESNNQLFLIDWEYTAVSDPALDIALFFYGNNLTIEQKKDFLTHYLNLIHFNEELFTAKIAEYQPSINLLNILWNKLATNGITSLQI
ncbi:phosphotransferase [Phocoenobacter skyensis]|uniref:Phosphotransferase n=1 Tax=Phocoenobacter skyensis TaxID=97481 RepID=A0A1H7TWR6_9PAST|nr:phosphotransferase [Pasteurella skyensis]MDP8162486.1 phosphotransferase [Pasteurella skyensis]MDP8170798.1 phosphotransferase [Pasteurella skyensis]MDP8172451.1 phosphotransferase [Pasteurella skyensis]MDP8174884.1 phosphotransferase [Pasteurella skyensis]MDP8177476.1 phosphotransferase [Pasteurella skyensis]